MTETIVSIVVGALAGLIWLPYARTRYWLSWNRGWVFAIGITVYLAIYGLAGLVGRGLAAATSWTPTAQSFLNGVIFGIVGAGLGRVQVTGFDPGAGREAFSLLSAAGGQVGDWIDGFSEEAVSRYLDSLQPPDMIRLARRLDQSYVRHRMNQAAAELWRLQLRDHLEQLSKADPGAQAEAQAALRGSIEEAYEKWNITIRLGSGGA